MQCLRYRVVQMLRRVLREDLQKDLRKALRLPLVPVITLMISSLPNIGDCGQHHSGAPLCDRREHRGRGYERSRSELRTEHSVQELARTVIRLSRFPCQQQKLAAIVPELLVPGCLKRAPGRELSQIANGISKLKSCAYRKQRRDVMLSVADIVSRTTARVRRGWCMKDLSMLACAFNVVPAVQEERVVLDALKIIAGEVAARETELGEGDCCPGYALITLANAISKAEGERVRLALLVIAREVVARRANFRNKCGSVLEPSVIMASALVRAEGPPIEEALKAIARRVLSRDGGFVDKGESVAQNLAMLAAAMSKLEGRDSYRVMKAVAREIINHRKELNQRLKWQASHLSNLVMGLGKIAEDDDAARALRELAGVVDLSWLVDEGEWPERRLATLANGLSKGSGQRIRRALKAVAGALVRREGLDNLHRWSAIPLVILANGISKLEDSGTVNKALTLIARELVRRQSQLDDTRGWSLQHMVMVANAISKAAGESEVTEALAIIAGEVVRRGPELGVRDGWQEMQLAVMAGALCRAREERVYQALYLIAGELLRRGAELHNHRLWQGRQLGAVANAIAKAPIDDTITNALNHIAAVVAGQLDRLSVSKVWSPQDIAITANALSKVEVKRDSVERALGKIAMALLCREEELRDQHTWTEQHLALVANAISKVPDDLTIRALCLIADAVIQRESKSKWQESNLALLARAFSQVPGASASRALELIAGEIVRRAEQLTNKDLWSMDSLVKVASGMHFESCTQAFERAAESMVNFSASDDHHLVWLLIHMSGWHLHDVHLKFAARIFQRLQHMDYTTGDVRTLDCLKWSITVMHFTGQRRAAALSGSGQPADTQAAEVLDGLAQVFADNYARYNQQWLDALSAGQEDRLASVSNDRWHALFTRDYWCKEAPEPIISCSHQSDSADASVSQSFVFRNLKCTFPHLALDMEVGINQFPVDILLNSNICIEVDGPYHFVPCSTCPAEALGCRRSKDLFIDHMLARYRLHLVRIPHTDTTDRDKLHSHIMRIQSLLPDQKTSRLP